VSADDYAGAVVLAMACDSASTADKLHDGPGQYFLAGSSYDQGTGEDASILERFRQPALAAHYAIGIPRAQRIHLGTGRTRIPVSQIVFSAVLKPNS